MTQPFVENLIAAIRKHRAQRLDDRCWLDDQELYAALGDDDLGDNSTPPADVMLKNCARFIAQRCKPGKWRSYQELEAEIAAARPVAEAGMELARRVEQFLSLAEGDAHMRNLEKMCEWCDKVFAANEALRKLPDRGSPADTAGAVDARPS